jgi:hypothetical protein
MYINVFATKSRLSVFTNITGAEVDHEEISSGDSATAAEILSADSFGSDSDKIFEDFGDIAMKQTPMAKKKNKSSKKVVVKHEDLKVNINKNFFN